VPTTPPGPDGTEIWYTTDGDPSGEPLLMIMGLASQHVNWPEPLVGRLVDRGFHVIRFDNRDVGLSSKVDVGEVPVVERVFAAAAGEAVAPLYTLSDMALDSVSVLDHLGLASAHVLGASMGGMIAQTVAIEHPERARSLTSVMSTTGASDVGQPRPEVLGLLLEAAPEDRAGAIARSLEISLAIGSPGLVDEAAVLERAALSYDRCHYPAGAANQLLAIVSAPDRTEALGGVAVPTLVVHGDVDPLVTVSGGIATAEAVPGAELRIVEGMGHDVPEPFWPVVVDELCALTGRASSPTA